MNLEAVLTEIKGRLEAAGLRAEVAPPDNIVPPAAFPNGDGEVTYNVEYGPTGMKVSLPYVVAVARGWSADTWSQLLAYLQVSGPASFKALVEAGDYASADYINVAGAEFGQATIGGVQYVSVAFTLEITGSEG